MLSISFDYESEFVCGGSWVPYQNGSNRESRTSILGFSTLIKNYVGKWRDNY